MSVYPKQKKKRSRQLGAIEKDVLQELSAGDLLYGFLLSARSSSRMMRLARQRANDRYRRKKAIKRLIALDYIQARGEKLSITTGGTNALGVAVQKNLARLAVRSWDYKWRIAVFDIPERYAPLRAKVRNVLKRSGFVMLQQSVWVFPHECEELVQLIKSESRLSQYILYGVLERIEDEKRLKKLFRLS